MQNFREIRSGCTTLSVDCGNGTEDAVITVTSDMAVKIVADCDGTDDSGEIIGHDVTQQIYVSYGPEPGPTGSTGNCYFKTPHDDSGMNFITLHLYYGRDINTVHSQQETYTVTCLNKPSKKEDASPNVAIQGFNLKGIVRAASDQSWTGTIELHLVDALDQKLESKDIPLGKRVQLRAVVSGGTSSITASDCLATGKDDATVTYMVLQAGCGDGVIFDLDQGFTTEGDTVRSPYFQYFRLPRNSGIKFSCNFTACDGECDGSSCVARRKRSANELSDFAATSKYSELKNTLSYYRDDSLLHDVIPSDLYDCLGDDTAQKSSQYSRKKHSFLVTLLMLFLGTPTIVSCILSFYVCLRSNKSSKLETPRECVFA